MKDSQLQNEKKKTGGISIEKDELEKIMKIKQNKGIKIRKRKKKRKETLIRKQ